MKLPLLSTVLLCALLVTIPGDAVRGAGVSHSLLWGENGEAWSPAGRLPDFSYAGYHRGERSLPDVDLDNAVSVKQFGAVGDGVQDDTAAFLKAIESVSNGVIFVPPGRYKITDILEIRKSNLVIAGAGPGESILYCPIPLNDIRPNWGETTSGQRTSNYSWSGGFIWLRGSFGQKQLASVTEPAHRGDRSLAVSSVANLRPGRVVEIYQKDDEQDSLAVHLYSGDAGNVGELNSRTTATLTTTILSMDGNTIHFDRALRFDVNPEWTPQIRSFEPTVTEVGVENLGFEFPNQPYGGHFTELGANAIAFSKAAHCWVRNIRIVNPDSGFFIAGRFNTVHGVVMESARRRDRARRSAGHHGLTFSDDDNLFTHFDYRTKFIHDITVTHAAGNVFSNGRGEDLSFDHHKRAPYENLFTDIDAGDGGEVWRCGGGADLGKNCGARGTFWNIRGRRPLEYPPASFGPPSMNIVGLTTEQSSVTNPAGKWFEVFDSALAPANLHRAQLARRLASARGFTEAAGFRGVPSIGSLATLFGEFGASAAVARSVPLPFELGRVKVLCRQDGGPPVRTPLLFVSENQINLQVPWELRPGPASVTVMVDGIPLDPRPVFLADRDYGLFAYDSGQGRAVAQNADGSLAQPEGSFPGFLARPARTGEPLVLYATGLGGVLGPRPEAGHNSRDGNGAWIRQDVARYPTVWIGGLHAPVAAAMLSPDFVGVYQINVAGVPPGVEPGDAVSLRIGSADGTESSRFDVTVAVAHSE